MTQQTNLATVTQGGDVDRYLTQTEVAEWLGVSRHTLRTLREMGTGPAFVLVGARVRYRESDVSAWHDAISGKRTRSQTPEARIVAGRSRAEILALLGEAADPTIRALVELALDRAGGQ